MSRSIAAEYTSTILVRSSSTTIDVNSGSGSADAVAGTATVADTAITIEPAQRMNAELTEPPSDTGIT